MASPAIGTVTCSAPRLPHRGSERSRASAGSSALGRLALIAAVVAKCGPVSDTRVGDDVECFFEPTGRTAAPHLGHPVAISANARHWVNNQVTDSTPIAMDGSSLSVVDGAGQAVAGTSEVVDHHLLLFRPAEPLTPGVTYSARTPRVTASHCAWSFTPTWPGSADPSWSLATLDGVRALDLALPSGGGALFLDELYPSIVLHRADASGALDGAVAATAVGPDFGTMERWVDAPGSVTARADGAVLLAGRWTGTRTGWWAQRLDAAGDPDDSFGTGGVVVFEEPTWSADLPYGVRVLPGAGGTTIVVLGGSGLARTPEDSVVRLLADGSLDPGFGAGGRLDALPDDQSILWSVLSLASGGFVVVSSGGACWASLARHDVSGTLDPTFGDAGRLCINHADMAVRAAVLDAEGRFILAGAGPNDTTALVRRLPDGQPDATFGQAGVVSLPGRYGDYLLAADGDRIALYREYLQPDYLPQAAITVLDDAGAIIRDEPVGDDLLVAGLALDTAGRTFVLGTLTGSSAWPNQLVLERLER
jgi:uncharacterized delta-60 repeat protein